MREIKLRYKSIKAQDLFGKATTIKNYGFISIRKYMFSSWNKIIVGYNTYSDKTYIRIVANKLTLVYGDNCSMGPRSSFWMEGDNNYICW
jgi:hypothetical protein